jgi:hypothetical protein
MIKKALRYALAISEDPIKIKEHMEQYLAAAGYDQRYKVKWKALSGNHKHTFSGIFEYAGQRYYFTNTPKKEIELERI